MTNGLPDNSTALAEMVSRTDLLLGRRGAIGALRDAEYWFETRPVQLRVGRDAISTSAGQAALITLATLLVRAGFPVSVDRELDAQVLVGPYREKRLSDVLQLFGIKAQQSADASSLGARELLLGDAAASMPRSLQVTWNGWISGLRSPGERLAETAGQPLAPILAAALAVSEIMESHLGVLDAGWRDTTVSLWHPTASDPALAQGPDLQWLPSSWLLIGLGHLGQASAWCMAHLPYRPGTAEIWLADNEAVTPANVSTGVLTHSGVLHDGQGRSSRKTRVVSAAVEQAGLQTRLVETRIHPSTRFHEGWPPIAVVGVDNLSIRRVLSDMGWPLVIDAGLGSTPSSFDSLSLHVFDGQSRPSREVQAWDDAIHPSASIDDEMFNELRRAGVDECGVVTLANKKVACAYVGMIASCLTTAEALRRTIAGPAYESLSLVLDAHVVRSHEVIRPALRQRVVDALPRP